MKSISWIEFAITFFIFLAIFIILFNNYLILFSRINVDKSYLIPFQRYLIASYILMESENKEIIKSLNLNIKYFKEPFLIFLSENEKNFSNCISFFYNFSNESINVIQNVYKNISSSIEIIIFSKEEISYILENSEIFCIDYLELKEEKIKQCILNLFGNSSIKIFPVKNIIIFRMINTPLSLYDSFTFYEVKPLLLTFSKFFEFYMIENKNNLIRFVIYFI